MSVGLQFHSTYDLNSATNPFVKENDKELPLKNHFYSKAPIFIPKEVSKKKELVHRKPEAIDKLVTTWSKALSKAV